jgi:peptide/nickel transport system permease protein
MTDLTASGSFSFVKSGTAPKARGYLATVLRHLRYDYVTLFFMLVIAAIVLTAILAPLLAPFDPNKTSMIYRLKPIGFKNFLLGTDELGRDMASRLIYGGRVSLVMGIAPVCIASIIGGLLGVVAGFFGGRLNMMIMRTVDVFYAFPSVLLAVAISGVMGGGMANGLVAFRWCSFRHCVASRRPRPPRCAASISSRPRAPAALPASRLSAITCCATLQRRSSFTRRA